MAYQEFIKPYPDGYEDGEIGNTPVTAAILNTNYDGFLLALNEFLPELADKVEANPSESATAGNLTKLKVGNSIYLVPSGGGSGSSVSFQQILSSGTKIGIITIDGNAIDVYAPTPSGGASAYSDLTDVTVSSPSTGQVPIYNATSEKWENGTLSVGDDVSFTQVVSTGTKLGTITINNTDHDIYAPTQTNPALSDMSDTDISSPTDGQVLTYDATNDVWVNADASGGSSSTEYSTSEQLIGKWTDGSDLFRRTFTINNWASNDWNPINDPTINVLGFVNEVSYFDGTSSAGYHRFSLNSSYGGTTVQFIVHDTAYNYNTTHGNVHVVVSGSNMSYRASVTIIYTKA